MPKKKIIRDFSNRRHFPGVTGNPFDVFLHKYDLIEKIPGFLFALILLCIAALATFANFPKVAILFVFFLSDWLLLYLLPRFEKSFGPPKPPVLTLAIFRSLVGWIPMEIFIPLQVLGSLLVLYGFWVEPHTILVSRQKLYSSKLSNNHSMRLLHLGDLHIEKLSRREKQLTDLVHQLKPDLILFSGDVLSLSNLGDPTAMCQARELMASWDAPFGAFAVSGSPAVDLPEVLPEIYKDLSVRLLTNEEITITIHGFEITLIGLSCTHRPHLDSIHLSSPNSTTSNQFRILLYHTPDLAPQASKTGIDLQLSGHTHGGQIRLPFIGPIFTGSLLGRAYSAGRYDINGMTLYVTRGIGMEGAGAPRVRFLCPPEIVLWEISGTKLESS